MACLAVADLSPAHLAEMTAEVLRTVVFPAAVGAGALPLLAERAECLQQVWPRPSPENHSACSARGNTIFSKISAGHGLTF